MELVQGLAGGGARVYTHEQTVRMLADTADNVGAVAPPVDIRPQPLAAPPEKAFPPVSTFTHTELRDTYTTREHAASADLAPLLAEMRVLSSKIELLAKRQGGVHVANITAADPDEAIRKLEAHERRQYLLANFS
jgi:hypothetical protein